MIDAFLCFVSTFTILVVATFLVAWTVVSLVDLIRSIRR